MKSKQYQQVVRAKQKKEKDTLATIKADFLHPEIGAKGANNRTIDIDKLMNSRSAN